MRGTIFSVISSVIKKVTSTTMMAALITLTSTATLTFTVTALLTSSLSCQTVPLPLEEYSLARAAMDAARAVQAPRHSPGYWHQADEAYRQGRLAYKDRDYAAAREGFIRARIAAEKAENSARLIRQKTGDVL